MNIGIVSRARAVFPKSLMVIVGLGLMLVMSAAMAGKGYDKVVNDMKQGQRVDFIIYSENSAIEKSGGKFNLVLSNPRNKIVYVSHDPTGKHKAVYGIIYKNDFKKLMLSKNLMKDSRNMWYLSEDVKMKFYGVPDFGSDKIIFKNVVGVDGKLEVNQFQNGVLYFDSSGWGNQGGGGRGY